MTTNIIEFPGGTGSDGLPIPLAISATPEQLSGIIIGRLLELQASVEAVASLVSDVIAEMDEREDRAEVRREVLEDFRNDYRNTLERLAKALQEQFPLKQPLSRRDLKTSAAANFLRSATPLHKAPQAESTSLSPACLITHFPGG